MLEADKSKSIQDMLTEFSQLGEQLGEDPTQLWMDAIQLWGSTLRKRVSRQRRSRLLRAAVLLAATAFEAWTNFLIGMLVQAGTVAGRRLTEAEIDCLRERRKVLRDGKIKEENARYSSRDRFLLLFQILNGNQALPESRRTQLKAAFDTRDELVHPKPGKFSNVLESGRGSIVIATFLAMDIELAKAWVKVKEGKPGLILVNSRDDQA